MRHRIIYRGDGWVLGICRACRRTNYVEPHGTTAKCKCSTKKTEHASIPQSLRVHGMIGDYTLVKDDTRMDATIFKKR